MKTAASFAASMTISTILSFSALLAPGSAWADETRFIRIENQKSLRLLSVLANSGAPEFMNDDETGIRVRDVWCASRSSKNVGGERFEGVESVRCAHGTTLHKVEGAKKNVLTQSIALRDVLNSIPELDFDCAMGACFVGAKSITCDTDQAHDPSSISCVIEVTIQE